MGGRLKQTGIFSAGVDRYKFGVAFVGPLIFRKDIQIQFCIVEQFQVQMYLIILHAGTIFIFHVAVIFLDPLIRVD